VRTASDAIAKGWKLVEIAGMVAAYQNILAFVENISLHEDLRGNQPTDVWEEWRNVSEFIGRCSATRSIAELPST